MGPLVTTRFFLLSTILTSAALWAGCPGRTVIPPYEACDDRTDVCDLGLACLPTTLPASAGFTGELCTATCSFDNDCPQDLNNFASICVNGQCYTQCPTGSQSCPYGTACLTFSDQNGFAVDICTP